MIPWWMAYVGHGTTSVVSTHIGWYGYFYGTRCGLRVLWAPEMVDATVTELYSKWMARFWMAHRELQGSFI